KAATPVADPAAARISSAPTANRFQMPRRSSSNSEVTLPDGLRQGAHEGDERLAVVRERLDRDPLLGPMVAAAHGAELDGRHAGVEEAVGVGCAVAADRDPVLRRPLG